MRPAVLERLTGVPQPVGGVVVTRTCPALSTAAHSDVPGQDTPVRWLVPSLSTTGQAPAVSVPGEVDPRMLPGVVDRHAERWGRT